MININNDLIKELRRRTHIGIIKCKQALIQAHGDIELAIDNIRKSGLNVSLQKINCVTSEGIIAIQILPNKKRGIMVEINCKTDFVAKNNTFQEFTKRVLITAMNEKIDDFDTLKIRFKQQLLNLTETFGENINIHRFAILTGEFIGFYLHGKRIGVLVSANGNVTEEFVKNIAMHIAANNPKYVSVDDISKEMLFRERRIQMDIAMKSEKSSKIIEKVVEGRMDKFMEEIVLIKQNFILDLNITISELLNKHHVTVSRFIRFEIGDNI